MFDIGFSEMMLIAVVALIVIGPQRLPRVARTVGHMTGRLQRYVNDVKADIDREMEFEELRKFKEQFQDAANSVEQTIHGEIARTGEVLKNIESAAAPPAEESNSGAPVAPESASSRETDAPCLPGKGGAA